MSRSPTNGSRATLAIQGTPTLPAASAQRRGPPASRCAPSRSPLTPRFSSSPSVTGGAGADVTTALERARGENIETAFLHGVVRFAGARHEQDLLGAELMERGIKSVRDLTREDAVDVARFLFSIPADLVDEQRALRELEQMRGKPEVVEPPRGAVLGGCFACASPVGDDDSTIGVHYFIAGRRRKDGTISNGRYEWRTFSPAAERGDYESRAGSRRVPARSVDRNC